ncbi:MAG: DUF423 domain-containing protein, partial [Cyanobacteria bacterium J069]
MSQVFVAIAALFGGLSVAAGAFGSHALRPRLSDRMLEIFETGARYQMYHALALLLVGLLLLRAEAGLGWLAAAGWAFVAGTLIFSGSLYAISVWKLKAFGMVTPVGGVLL